MGKKAAERVMCETITTVLHEGSRATKPNGDPGSKMLQLPGYGCNMCVGVSVDRQAQVRRCVKLLMEVAVDIYPQIAISKMLHPECLQESAASKSTWPS